MGFEKVQRSSFREGRGGSKVKGVRLHGAQMWFTRTMTEEFLDLGVKAAILMVDRKAHLIRLIITDIDDLNGFNVLYQLRNKYGRFTRSVINATGLMRELGLPTQSCIVKEVKGGYEFEYVVSK